MVIHNFVPAYYPNFLLKNFDPYIHKSEKDLIQLVQIEIDLFWENKPMAIRGEQNYRDAVLCLKRLKGIAK